VLDRGLVRFLKYVVPLLGIFTLIGVSFFFVDLKQARKDIEETWTGSQKLDISIKAAQLDLTEQTTKLQKDIETAEKAAQDANTELRKMRDLANRAEDTERVIEQNRDRSIVAIATLTKVPTSASNPIQIQRLVVAELIDALRDVLPGDQYALLRSKVAAQQKGIRRQIYDAKNTEELPGILVRTEGDAPVADQDVNQAYDGVGLINGFVEAAFGRNITDGPGGSFAVTVHYAASYDNAFWNGEQLVVGDGDGKVFRIGGFKDLSIVAGTVIPALLKQPKYRNQSGAIQKSFSNIVGTLMLQWQNMQTVEQASWLVGQGIFPGSRTMALVSVKDPGSAYDDPDLGHDPQVATMSKYDKTEEDDGGVHTNSGIPNRAFYELAKQIGGYAWEKPLKVWYESVRGLKPDATFQDLANATVETAARLYGQRSRERQAVVESWAVVEIVAGRGQSK
jgi:Zn-dependent metalloprotease